MERFIFTQTMKIEKTMNVSFTVDADSFELAQDLVRSFAVYVNDAAKIPTKNHQHKDNKTSTNTLLYYKYLQL